MSYFPPPRQGLPLFVALYLPQYHPIPENDAWWGKGFTEWTQVTKARPLFRGHVQPRLPSDLGFYDLRVPETREAQAQLALSYGVDAFCYYHYWFGHGRRLLQRPFEDVLASGKPDFPFMLCWANQTWTGVWHGLDSRILIDQQYPGLEDEVAHFAALLPAFRDPRYLRLDGKPIFMVYRPLEVPELRSWCERWRRMAKEAGLGGLYLIGEDHRPDWDPTTVGLDAYVHRAHFERRPVWVPWSQPVAKIRNKIQQWQGRPTVLDARKMVDHFVADINNPLAVACVLPNWDNTPRSGSSGVVLTHTGPEFLERQLQRALNRSHQGAAHRGLLFIKSWNEWAEGNCLEPGRQWGLQYLEVIQRARRASPAIRSTP